VDEKKTTILNIRKTGAEHMLNQAADDAVEIMKAQYQAFQSIARGLDEAMNGDLRGDYREIGFVLICYPFHEIDAAASFVTNGDSDFITLLEHQLAILKQNKEK